MHASWIKTAKVFYAKEARDNLNRERYQTFVHAYEKLAPAIPVQNFWQMLDVGCGTGMVTAALSGKVKSIVGIDISPESLAVARQYNPGCEFLEADMTRLPFPDEAFDCVVAMTSLEFCLHKEKAFSEIKRVLKPGGFFFLEVRNADFVIFKLPKPMLGFLIRAGILIPYPAENFRDLGYEEWKQLVGHAGFKLKRELMSLMPWNYGALMTRLKNLFINAIKAVYPVNSHYLVGFLFQK